MITHLLHTNSVFEINTHCSFFCNIQEWRNDYNISYNKKARHYIVLKKILFLSLKIHKLPTLNYSFLSAMVHNHVYTEFIQKQRIHLVLTVKHQVMIIENRATA